MSSSNTDTDSTSPCANCGKESNSDNMNTCNKCKMVKYCNAACKKKHRKKHKKACEKRVAELHDQELFKEPPPHEECPLCFLPFSLENKTSTFKSCCGKRICNGCVYAMIISEGKDLCAFCRTPRAYSVEAEIKRMNKLIDKGNAKALFILGGWYASGMGMPRNRLKGNELYLKAGELGYAEGYYNLGQAYHEGEGVERDVKKARHYYELAAMGGSISARHSIGCIEGNEGNTDRAFRHFILAAKAGHEKASKGIKVGFENGYIAKDEYANTLLAYNKIQDEMMSDAREEAAASGIFR